MLYTTGFFHTQLTLCQVELKVKFLGISGASEHSEHAKWALEALENRLETFDALELFELLEVSCLNMAHIASSVLNPCKHKGSVHF